MTPVRHRLGETVVIEENGQPAAVLISFALFEQILRQRDAASQVVTTVQQQNKDLAMDEDELLAWVDEAVHGIDSEYVRE